MTWERYNRCRRNFIEDEYCSLYARPTRPKMIPVQREMTKAYHLREEDGQSKRNDRPRYEFEGATIFEEGQEIMLIEGLQQIRSTATVNEECLAKNGKIMPSESTRKVHQVLLVPSSGDLIMERYRQASQRAQKARGLLDHALNWDVTVPNRGKLATDALTEAGKARLLIEPKRTPELMAMLADAKKKGEEEAFRAADHNVSVLVPAVQIPAGAADQVSASVHRDKPHHCPGLENIASATTTGMTTRDPAMHVSQDAVALMSRGHDDYEGCDDADEHAYRAKQYLEFILPDLGDEARDDSFVATDAGKANVYKNVQVTAPESYDESSALGEISSLGFDQSRSFDNLSLQYSDDVFSMSSLNEIMDAPIDEFTPDKIMNIPSMKQKMLTIRMSFGRSMSQSHFSPKPAAAEDAAGTVTAPNAAQPSSEVQASTAAPLVLQEGSGKSDKCRLGLAFAKTLSALAPNSGEEGHHTRGLLWRFRSTKKRTENEKTEFLEGSIRGHELRMTGAALCDLSDARQSESVAPSMVMAQGKQNKPEAKEEKQSSTRMLKGGTSSQVSSTMKLSNQENEGVERSLQSLTDAHNAPAKCSAPKLKVVTTNITANVTTNIAEILEPIEDVPCHEWRLLCERQTDGHQEDKRLKQRPSHAPNNIASEILEPIADVPCDDRHVVRERQRGGHQGDKMLKQWPSNTPSSIASIREMARCCSPREAKGEAIIEAKSPCISTPKRRSRYSPIGVRSEEIVHNCTPCNGAFPCNSGSGHHVNDAPYTENPSPLQDIMTKSVTPTGLNVSSEENQTEGVMSVSSESTEKEAGSLATNGSAVPITPGSTAAKKNKKKKLSVISAKSITPTVRPNNASLERKRPEGAILASSASMGKEAGSLTSSKIVMHSGSKTAEKNKKKRPTLMGLFHGKESTRDANEPNATSNQRALKLRLAQTLKDKTKPCSEKQAQREKVSYLQASTKRPESPSKKSEKAKPAQNEARCADSATLPLQHGENPATTYPPKAPLQLTNDTVEMKKTESTKRTFSFCCAQAAPASLDVDLTAKKTSAVSQNQKADKNGKASQTAPGIKARCFDKKCQQKRKKYTTTQDSTTDYCMVHGSQTNTWVLRSAFSTKRESQLKDSPEKSRDISATSSATPGGPTNEEPPCKPPQKSSPSRALLPIIECLSKQGYDTHTARDKTPEQSLLRTSNPLLPFQLIKQLEEQSMFDDATVKEAAERSIIQSHTKAMQHSHASEATGMSNILEKENRFSPLTPLIAEGTGTLLGGIVSHAPRALVTNNTTLSIHCQDRPDADGINARKKGVREVLGLPATVEFDADGPDVFLSHITAQRTHHQDLGLPDP